MKQKRSSHNECYDLFESPVGPLHLIFNAAALTGISFEKPHEIPFRQTKHSALAIKELGEYFERGRKTFTCRTAFITGTDFEQKTWNALLHIPYGETRAYKWLAEEIGQPHASRAAGQALSKNPIPIIFPCHRIIESDGSLGGYSSGTEIKRRLLEIEYYTRLSRHR